MEKLKYEQYQEVRLTREQLCDFTWDNELYLLKVGQSGQIMDVFPATADRPYDTYDVEFYDENDQSIGVTMLTAEDIEPDK